MFFSTLPNHAACKWKKTNFPVGLGLLGGRRRFIGGIQHFLDSLEVGKPGPHVFEKDAAENIQGQKGEGIPDAIGEDQIQRERHIEGDAVKSGLHPTQGKGNGP